MKARDRIESLRKRGYKVHITHIRPVANGSVFAGEYFTYRELRERDADGRVWDPRGGATECLITDKSGNEHLGIAVCSPEDNFVKNAGVNIALGRAISALCHGKKLPVGPSLRLDTFAELDRLYGGTD